MEVDEETSSAGVTRCDSYEDQLRSLFLSCDQEGNGKLNREELAELCAQLELNSSQAEELISQLVSPTRDRVEFEDFKHALVALLERQSSDECDNVKNEVSDSENQASSSVQVVTTSDSWPKQESEVRKTRLTWALQSYNTAKINKTYQPIDIWAIQCVIVKIG